MPASPEVNYKVVDDIEINGFCFTDGAGFISMECADRVASRLELAPVPSAF